MVKQILIVKEIFFEHVNYITSKPLNSVHTLYKEFILRNHIVKIGFYVEFWVKIRLNLL